MSDKKKNIICPKCGWETLEYDEDDEEIIEYCWNENCDYSKKESKEEKKLSKK